MLAAEGAKANSTGAVALVPGGAEELSRVVATSEEVSEYRFSGVSLSSVYSSHVSLASCFVLFWFN